MNLAEAVAKLDELKDDAVFCVRHPWSETAECRVVALDENLSVPDDVKAAGFPYFLEATVAREVLGVFGEKPPSLDEKVRLLLYYAENDAYPEWVYQR